jgi:hypothetical protein
MRSETPALPQTCVTLIPCLTPAFGSWFNAEQVNVTGHVNTNINRNKTQHLTHQLAQIVPQSLLHFLPQPLIQQAGNLLVSVTQSHQQLIKISVRPGDAADSESYCITHNTIACNFMTSL